MYMCVCVKRERERGGEWQKRYRTSFRHSRKLLGAAEPITRTPSTAADEATYDYVRTDSPGAKRLLNSPTATVSKLLNTQTKAIVVFIRARPSPFGNESLRQFRWHPPICSIQCVQPFPRQSLHHQPMMIDPKRHASNRRDVQSIWKKVVDLRLLETFEFRPSDHNHNLRHGVDYSHNII